MAITKIADIIKPQVLGKMVPALLTEHMDFLATGLATSDYDNVKITEGGVFVEVPYYNELTGSDEVITDSTSLTPQKIATGKDIGVVCHRGAAWGSRELAKILSGDDPMKEFARQLSKFWAYRMQRACISVLNGVFDRTSGVLAGGGSNSHYNYVAQGASAAVTMSDSGAIDTLVKLGDQMGQPEVMICHSKVWADIVKAKLATNDQIFTNENTTVKNVPTYMGMRVIVTDDVPTGTDSGKTTYTTYFAKKGVMYLGMQQSLKTETDRDILAQEDVIASTVHFVPHLKLVKWGVSTENPDNTALATAGNWTKIATNNKFIPIVAMVTN